MKLNHIFKRVASSVADPDAGSIAFLISGSGVRDGKNPDLGSRMNIPDHSSESLETVFWVSDPGSSGSLWIRDPGWKNSDPGSGINIPDPQPKLYITILLWIWNRGTYTCVRIPNGSIENKNFNQSCATLRFLNVYYLSVPVLYLPLPFMVTVHVVCDFPQL